MNLSRFHLLWLLLPLWVACSQEEQLSSPAPDGWQACRLYFDGPAPCFEASAQRATAAWPDQACVYLSFDTEYGRHETEIDLIGIHQAFMNKGLGTILLQTFVLNTKKIFLLELFFQAL